MRPDRRSVALLAASYAVLLSSGCALVGGGHEGVVPVRLTEILDEGDPARRASLRLLIEGLEADSDGRAARARGLYDRALQVDPTNPYAFLTVARHEAEGIEPSRALAPLEHATLLFEQEQLRSARIDVHLVGLRGAVLYATGHVAEGVEALEEARSRAPEVWSDGQLSADELR